MRQASSLFSKEEVTRIEAAVAEAEKKTSAELVPVVATASGRYDRPEDIAGLWTGIALMAAAWLACRGSSDTAGDWGLSLPAYELPILIGAMVAGFIIGAVAASRIGWLRRLFTPWMQMREDVAAKAREVFFDQRVHRTQGATGLLLYVSLFERTAFVLGDDAVVDKLGHEALDEICRQLTDGLKTGDPASAFCAALSSAGDRLAAVLPRAEDDVDELSNTLILIDA